MAMTYAQLEDVASRIVRDLASEQSKLDQQQASFTVSETALTGMQTTYAGWAGEVNAYLTANPNSDAAKTLKAKRNALVAEFAAAKTRATAFKDAVAGI